MRALVAFLLLCSVCFGQVTVTTPQALSGLTDVRQVGDMLLVGEDSKPVLQSIGLIQVATEASNVIVKVTDSERNTVPVAKVDAKTYTVTQSGKLWVRTVCIDFAKNIYTDEESAFTVGPPPLPPPPPPPPPPPIPDVPADAFDNIGQRVAVWSKGMTANAAVGACYAKWAKELRTNPAITINDASAAMSSELRSIPNYAQYNSVTTQINADLAKRWPVAKGVLADYWTCIALGLGVK